MSETRNPKVILQGDKVVTTGVSKETRSFFYDELSKRAVLLENDEYKRLFPNSSGAHFSGVIFQIPEGKLIEDAKVFVNKDDFFIDGEDYSDLIPIVVRHEVAEMYMYAKAGYSLSPAPASIGERRLEVGHSIALREEYRYAFTIGKAERYLDFWKKWIRNQNLSYSNKVAILKENQDAFDLISKRQKK